MKKNTHRLHAELSEAIKVAAKVRDQLNSDRLSTFGRLRRQLHYLLLVFHVTCILQRIRSSGNRY
jgi:hypothetical protein